MGEVERGGGREEGRNEGMIEIQSRRQAVKQAEEEAEVRRPSIQALAASSCVTWGQSLHLSGP